MIDDKKIEEAARQRAAGAFISEYWQDCYKEGFVDCATWMQEEFLKDLLHPASEVPRNDKGKILAFSKVNSNIKLYDMNAMLKETACDTYQEMWEIRVRAYTFTDWIFVDELLDLITKGGENERA